MKRLITNVKVWVESINELADAGARWALVNNRFTDTKGNEEQGKWGKRKKE